MKRKKTNVILIAIVLSLTAVLTTQAKAATTFYEVWRSYDGANPEISEYIGLSENNSLYDYSPQVGSYTTYWVRACKGRVFETSAL